MYDWKYFIGLVVLLTAVTFAVHGHALEDGLFLDDHWHELRLAEGDWSWSALLNSTTIAPERFMHTWWHTEEISWWYIRPFAMFISKLVYHLSDGSVKALHAMGLALHLGNALLVHHLVLRMTRKRWWSMVAALLMLVYSHSVYAVAWLAAQNALLQTFLMLLAMLAYIRASGLNIYAGPKEDGEPDSGWRGRRPVARGVWGIGKGSVPVDHVTTGEAAGKLRDAVLTHDTQHDIHTTQHVTPVAQHATPVTQQVAHTTGHVVPGAQLITPITPSMTQDAGIRTLETPPSNESKSALRRHGQPWLARDGTGEIKAKLAWGWTGLFFLLWGLAICSRESAVVLPAIVAGFDLAFGGWQHLRKRIKLYVVMAIFAVAFAYWRVIYFNHPMPDFYVQRPHGPEYVFWWLAKLLHYVTATVWLSPMTIGPSGRFNPWREVPGDCILMLVIVGIMGAGYYLACRRVRGYWLWPLWIFLGLLPVVPILATPHNGYLPSVGFAIAMALGPALRDKTRPTSIGKWCAVVATWFLIATSTYVPIYRPMWYSMLAAERMTIEQIMRLPPAPQVTDVFFINVPFVNIYAAYHIDSAMGRGAKLGVARQTEPLYRTHTLTYAPDLLRMDQPCRVEQIDAHRFRVAILGDRPYFSGALGRYLIEGMRPGQGPLVTAQQLPGDVFDVTVLRADEQGVRELEFVFHQPLASERFCFYVGTPSCAAARMRFAPAKAFASPDVDKPDEAALDRNDVTLALTQLRAGRSAAANVLFKAASSSDEQISSVAQAGIAEICQPVAEALAAPILTLTSAGDAAWADWNIVRRWWSAHVDDAAVEHLPAYQADFAGLRWQRDALFRIRQTASTIIQTDLYLTGSSFPGPR